MNFLEGRDLYSMSSITINRSRVITYDRLYDVAKYVGRLERSVDVCNFSKGGHFCFASRIRQYIHLGVNTAQIVREFQFARTHT